MKNQLQSRKPNFKRKPHQREHATITVEQSASTAIASERAWIWLSLVLVVVIAGLYWLSDRQENQAAWSYETVDGGQSAAESIIADQGVIDLEDQTKLLPEDLISPTMSINSQNEQMVRRYYEEVLNQRRFAVMDDLFAENFTYQAKGVQNLAALKQQIRSENAIYEGLTYTIEGVNVEENRIIVNWSAAGRPVNAPLPDVPQFWSGRTGWQIVDGRIVCMLILNDGSEPAESDEDDFWQIDPCQND